jgi:uncharacterized protein YjbI with pentapeptide repeats
LSVKSKVSKHICHRFLKLIVGCCLVLTTTSHSFAQVDASDGSVLPTTVHVREFAADPSLIANGKQMIVFGPADEEANGRYSFSAGTHKFCLGGGAHYFTGIELQTSDGRDVSLTLDSRGCARAEVAEGITSVRLVHGQGPKPPAWVTAGVRVDEPESNPYIPPTPLVDSQNSPVAGYWVIEDTTLDPRGSYANLMTYSTVPGPGAGQIQINGFTLPEYLSFWQFPSFAPTAFYPPFPPALYSYNAAWFLPPAGPPFVTTNCDQDPVNYCENAYGIPTQEVAPNLQINDLGNYSFTFKLNPESGNESLSTDPSVGGFYSVLMPTFGDKHGDPPPDTLHVLFRYIPSTDFLTPPPQPGEVQIFQGCNYQGPSSIFIPLMGTGVVSDPYYLRLLSGLINLNNTGQSVLIGAGSGIYWGSDQAHLLGAAVSNQSCLPNRPQLALYVEPVADVLLHAHSLVNTTCVNCVLAGQTLNPTAGSAASNFEGWDFTGADFSHSNLSNVDLTGADLSYAKFTGATLNNVKFNNARVSSAGLDFTGATLTNVTFNGVNISNFNFSNGTLSNVDLSGTTAPAGNVTLTGATMNKVSLSGVPASAITAVGAAFCGVSLTGTDRNHILDLTSGSFANVKVTLGGSCTSNLAYTNITPIVVAGSWAGSNLTGTQINLPAGQVLSTQAHPFDFTNVQIAGASLQNVVLDYATGLSGRNLSGIHLNNSSLRFVDLHNATLHGAQFSNANLEGSNMTGVALTEDPSNQWPVAELGGAFLRNVNLSQAQLSGADFSSSNFYSQIAANQNLCSWTAANPNCATAAGATMSGTSFNGAYLFGVDFTKSTAQGVNFGGAFLTGANFSGAVFTADLSNGASLNFANAFLQGTNLQGVTVEDGATFRDAYVDFSMNGNVIYLSLGTGHTGFAGYWGNPNNPVCAEMTYTNPTTLPTTDGSVICPDGNSGGSGCGPAYTSWKSKGNIQNLASYQYDSTFTPAAPPNHPFCNLDKKWVPIVASQPPPPHRCRRHHHPHPPVCPPGKPHRQ